jgi:hypothetical protein
MAVPANALILLDFIGKAETARTGIEAFNTIIGHRESKLNKPLVEFTLAELLNAQKTWGKNWRSSAAGKYQIIRKTLMDLCARLGLKAEQKFTPELQDQLAYELLKGRGYADFATGKLAIKSFALALSKEWASLPVLFDTQGANGPVKRGTSYYAGDGLNGATVSPVEFEAVLAEVLNAAAREPDAAPPLPPNPPPMEEHEKPIAPPPATRGLNWWVIGAVLAAAALAFIAFVPLPI